MSDAHWSNPDQLIPFDDDVSGGGPRLLVIGPTREAAAGYLGRTYGKLWDSPRVAVEGGSEQVRVHADGAEDHRAFLAVASGGTSAAGASQAGSGFEVDWRGERVRVEAMDASSEVVRSALTGRGGKSLEALQVLAAIDSCLGVVVLLDPAVDLNGEQGRTVDLEFLHVGLVRRVRERSAGVPMAVVLLNAHRHAAAIKADGGLRGFLAKHHAPMLREIGAFKVFAGGVQGAQGGDAGGKSSPVGYVEPLVHCLTHQPATSPGGSLAGSRAGSPAESRAAVIQSQPIPMPRLPSPQPMAEPVKVGKLISGVLTALVVIAILTFRFGPGLVRGLSGESRRDGESAATGDEYASLPSRHDRTYLSAEQAAAAYKRMLACTPKIVLRAHYRLLDGGGTIRIPYSEGSGFVVTPTGLIVTNRHVVETIDAMSQGGCIGTDLQVVFLDMNPPEVYGASVVRMCAPADLALLQLSGSRTEYLQFGPMPTPGEPVRAYGFPGRAEAMAGGLNEREARLRQATIDSAIRRGQDPSVLEWVGRANIDLAVVEGIVSALRRSEMGDLIQTDAPVHSGNSGGPLLDLQGRVIGIVTMGDAERESINFCIAVSTMQKELKEYRGIQWDGGR